MKNLSPLSDKQYHHGFFNNLNEVIYFIDLKGIIRYISPEIESSLGYRPDKVLGNEFKDLIFKEDKERFVDDFIKAQTGWKMTGVYRVFDNMQEIHWMRISGNAVKEKEEVTGLKGLIIDITDQMKKLEVLKQAKIALELKNAELLEAIKEANKISGQAEMDSISKNQFLVNINHEIRTPLNGIVGMLSLLLDSELSDEQREYVEIANKSTEDLTIVINDILDISKIETGKLKLEILNFDLRTLIEDVINQLKIRAVKKGISLYHWVHHEVPSLLKGDPGRIRQVLSNILNNAVKFTDEGEVSLDVSLLEEIQDSATIHFRIQDTGIGIPEKFHSRVFTSFAQADASFTRKYEGMGLELSITKKLIDLMNGQIGFKSAEGKGSTFWFTITLEKQVEQKELDIKAAKKLLNVRVLIVEDDETEQIVLEKQLVSWGCRVLIALNASEAIYLLRENIENKPFDIVLIKRDLKDIPADVLGMQIKKDKNLASIILILITSFGRRGEAKRYKEIGFAAYLTKPFNRSVLFDCLISVLNNREQGGNKDIITRHSIAEDHKSKSKILLVEDNAINQKVSKRVLEKYGFKVDTVFNGEEALDACKNREYSIILMDILLPLMDGYEVTRRIRQMEKKDGYHIPIIAITAFLIEEDKKKCLEAGMDDFITKPIQPKALIEAIERQITRNPVLSLKKDKVEDHINDKTIYNRKKLLKRLDNDIELINELEDIFLKDIPVYIQNLKKALDEKDAYHAERQAHTIKGSSLNIEAVALSKTAYRIEKALKEKNLNLALSLVPKLENEFGRFCDCLKG